MTELRMLSLPVVVATIVSSRGRAWPGSTLTGCFGHRARDWRDASLSVRHCLAYTDDEKHSPSRLPAGMRLVRPSEYMTGMPAGPVDCCSFSDSSGTVPRTDEPSDASSRMFFCSPHRKSTLRAQYRFIPALAHARRVYHHEWRDGRLKWLILADDDSHLNLASLAEQLHKVDPNRAVLLGDVVKWHHAPWWHDPEHRFGTDGGFFACGGAGSILSRTAILAADLTGCAHWFGEGCFQSDWMIGKCFEQAGVAALREYSCGLCENACKKSMHRLLRSVQAKISQGVCAFAQFEARVMRECNVSSRSLSLGLQICDQAFRLAISHGFPRNASRTACKTRLMP